MRTDAGVRANVRLDAARRRPPRESVRERVLAYYNAATPDYAAWSRQFNMHFGYWRWPLNPFDREPMLEELNRQVVRRLDLPRSGVVRIADLGGGTGATARVAVAMHANVAVDVVTLIPCQVELGRSMNAGAPRGEAISMHCADYTATPLRSGAYKGVCILEAACHADGAVKSALIREAHRLLEPGGTLVIADAMLKRELPRVSWFDRLFARVYDLWCESWAVPEMCRIDLLGDALIAAGFSAPLVEDWSWRIMPSVAHVPLLASSFAIKATIAARGKLPAWRRRHIVASLLTPLLGLRRSAVAYVAVTARKPG